MKKWAVKNSYICGHCGEFADTVHFNTKGSHYIDSDKGVDKITFCCPRHDDGAYWVELDRWDQDMYRHVSEKRWWTDETEVLMYRIGLQPATS